MVLPTVFLISTTSPALAAPPETPELTVKPIFASTATFNGILSPAALEPAEGTYKFLYKASPTECEGGSETTPGIALGGAPEVLPPEQVEGLTPATEYTVCLQITNLTAETSTSAPLAFKTAPATAPEPPEATEPTELKATTATVNGVVNPLKEGEPGHFRFIYAQSPSSCEAGSETPEEPAPGFPAQAVSAPISSLEQGKPYTFCVKAINALGESTLSPPRTFETAITPETPTGLEVKPMAATTATLNGVLNPGALGNPGTYEFFYQQSATECDGTGHRTAPEPAGAATGATPEPVAAEVKELLPNMPYTFCLLARNGAGEEALSAPVTFTTLIAPPTIVQTFATDVASTSVTLGAQLDPGGAETTYHFDYGTTEAYGQSTPQSLTVGSDDSLHPAVAHIQGLQAGTVYHYRIVATNSDSPAGGTPGPDETFTTQHAGGEFALPDGRQYEMVTPPQKQGALFFGFTPWYQSQGHPIQASLQGNAIVDQASQPTEPEPPGYTVSRGTSVLSTRGPGGWSSQVIEPPHEHATSVGIGPGEYYLFSEDLSLGAVQQFGDFQPYSPEATESTPYLHTDYLNANVSEHCQASCFRPLVTAANTPPGTVFGESNFLLLRTPGGRCEGVCGPNFVGASLDLRHVVMASPVQLTSTPVHNRGEALYEWSEGHLQPASIFPKGEENVEREAGVSLAGTTQFGGYEEENGAKRAVSENGERVIFISRHGGSTAATGLYLRDLAKGETIKISSGGYLTANGDASRVFFGAGGGDLYEFQVTSAQGEPLAGRVTDLTVDPTGAGVVAMLGTSDDGSYVYFAAIGALTPDANIAPECVPGTGNAGSQPKQGCNVFVRHNGVTSLVAPGWIAGNNNAKWARVSPDGRWLAFMSTRSLTGYDNRDAVSGEPDAEVYLYHADTGGLVCASCDPTGARPVGVPPDASGPPAWVAANLPSWAGFSKYATSAHQSRYLSDGGRLFFESHGPLVPQDVNGTGDVYQYEPEGYPSGAHACSSASSSGSDVFKPARAFEVQGRTVEEGAGCVALISSGTSSEESSFLDASETGADVFVLTTSRLAPQDFDTAPDVYDAHECTTQSPCIYPPAAAPPACTTEAACKPSPTPQPGIYGLPSSATFSGPGNLTPAPPPPVKPKTAAQIRAEKLSRALKACHKDKKRKKRQACEKQARKRYGAKASAKKSSRANSANTNRRAGR